MIVETLIKNLDRKETVSRDEIQNLAIEVSKIHDNIFFNWVTRCHTKDYLIRMFDGTNKKVQDIQIGDIIMGDDSTPRTVLKLHSIIDECFEIIPNKGDSFIVNAEHILVLHKTNIMSEQGKIKQKKDSDKRFKNVIEISVKDFLKTTNQFKHIYKLKKTPINYLENENLPMSYFLGLWLGDGNSNNVAITNVDEEIILYLKQIATQFNCNLRKYKNSFIFSNLKKGFKSPLYDFLKNLNLINNKHIPLSYLTASVNSRLELLAGLLDTDGYLAKGNIFEITQKNKTLAYNIYQLCLDLGFRATIRTKLAVSTNSKNHKGTVVYRIFISGDLFKIPTKIARKQAIVTNSKVDFTKTGFEARKVESQKTFGFTIDGNNRYIDFQNIIHHNCGKSLTIMKIAEYHKFDKVLMVNAQTIHIENFKKDAEYHKKDISNFTCICWNSYDKYLDHEWDLIIIDECDNALNASLEFLSKVRYKRVIFLSATITWEQEKLLRSQINYFKWKITLDQAINWQILPEPTIWLKTIKLDSKQQKEFQTITDKLEYYKNQCEEKGWKKWQDLSERECEAKRKDLHWGKDRWELALEKNPNLARKEVDTWEAIQVLRTGGARKKFFEKVKKEWFDKNKIFDKLKTQRTLFFLPDIKSNQKLGNAVSSLETKKENGNILDDFNNGKIDYIISNKILIRGVNLFNINWAYFGVIDLNGTSLTQSFGRVLLGISPNILAVCCEGTKEEKVLNNFIKKLKIIPKELKI